MQQDRNSLLQRSGSTRTENAFQKCQLVIPSLEAIHGPVSTSWVLRSTCGISNTDAISFLLVVLKSFQQRPQARYFDAVLCSYRQNMAAVFLAQ